MNTQTNNPLEKYFRAPSTYVRLPSANSKYINDDLVTYDNDNNELAVYPMTAKDEMMFRNPDALIAGNAVTSVIQSCVPGVKKPKKLLKNDIDFLLAVIKNVSYEAYDIEVPCPKCEHINQYSLDISELVERVDQLDEVYPVNLSNGLTVFVSPFRYETTLKVLAVGFESNKFIGALTSDADELERLHHISEIIQRMAELNQEVMVDTIIKIVSEQDGIDVSDKKQIDEFLRNARRDDAELIYNEVNRISEIGLMRTMEATCQNEECLHEWEAAISFDPVAFFTRS
jgi:hypothetical protein